MPKLKCSPFFKQAYKSSKVIRQFAGEIIKSYQKVVSRGRVDSFSQLRSSRI